jgi:hypothetical protein
MGRKDQGYCVGATESAQYKNAKRPPASRWWAFFQFWELSVSIFSFTAARINAFTLMPRCAAASVMIGFSPLGITKFMRSYALSLYFRLARVLDVPIASPRENHITKKIIAQVQKRY